MRELRRAITGLLVALAGVLGSPAAQAQDYPSRPVRVIVGFAPGAVADLIAQAISATQSE